MKYRKVQAIKKGEAVRFALYLEGNIKLIETILLQYPVCHLPVRRL